MKNVQKQVSFGTKVGTSNEWISYKNLSWLHKGAGNTFIFRLKSCISPAWIYINFIEN